MTQSRCSTTWPQGRVRVKSTKRAITSQSAATAPSGIHFRVDPAATHGQGTWSVIHTSSQPDDKDGDPPNVNTLFAIAEDVFVHAAITETGVRLALLSGDNLIQSNHIWSLSPSSTIAPRLFAFNGTSLQRPYDLPMLRGKASISSFTAVSNPTRDVDFLLFSTDNSTFGVTLGTDILKLRTTVFALGDGTLPNSTESASTPTFTSVPSPSATVSSQPVQSADRMTSSIIGSVAGIICILTFLYCRYFRKGRVQDRIDRIMNRRGGSAHAASLPTTIYTPVSPTTTLSNHGHHGNPHVSYEESDQLCIEMQRQQLGLMQPHTASLNSVVRPDAPPETAILITDDSTPTLSSSIPMTPPSPSAPLLQSHSHSLHPHHGPSPLSSPTSSHQRLHSYLISVDEHGKDVIRNDVLSEKMSSSPSIALLQTDELLQHSGHHASSSSSRTPYGVQQQQPESFANQEKNPRWEEDECGPFHCASSSTIVPGNCFAVS
ncbi:MAG: hypothetical protein J3Q66DRAFT_355748 [Benniella sp.]|nr:MAG: hypothetical protein J3Q66DRAFT_355748 [Benniella sp.]